MEGSAIVVVSAIFISAGAIVWNAATSYQDEIKSAVNNSEVELRAVIQVFSSDMERLSDDMFEEMNNLSYKIEILSEKIYALDDRQNNILSKYDEEENIEEPIPLLAETEEIIIEEFQETTPPPKEINYYQQEQIFDRIQQSKGLIQQQIQQQR